MAFLTEDEFRDLYVTQSESEISTAQIEQCLDEAVDVIAKLCGETAVSEIENATDDSLRKNKAFRRSQGKLAYRALLLLQSSRYRAGGIIASEKDQNDTVVNSFVKFDEIEKRRESLYTEALDALGSYLIRDAEGDSFGNAVEFSHPADTGACCR